MLGIFIIISLGTALIVQSIHQMIFFRQVKSISQGLAELRSNERFFLHASTRSTVLNELAEQVNLIGDHLQSLNQRTKRLEKVQRQVMTHIAHDLRTPLTSLSGYAELLKNKVDLSHEEMTKYADIIFLKSQNMTRIIRDFFEWARLEADDVKMNFQKVNMVKKVEEVLLSFLQDFNHLGVEPILDLPKSPLWAWADPASIERILSNLITNSLRYGADGGKHGIRMWSKEGRVWIEIWDSGQGILPENIPFVFERLYKGKRHYGSSSGSGLGLSITKKLIEKHHGEIFVHSVPFEKTSFTFYI